MSRNLTLTALACLALAACGTPQEQCISRNTDEYRTVARLLAQVEGNLARGYAWDERVVTRTDFDFCPTLVRDLDGEDVLVHRSCWRDVADTEVFRVPIDPVIEQRRPERDLEHGQAGGAEALDDRVTARIEQVGGEGQQDAGGHRKLPREGVQLVC